MLAGFVGVVVPVLPATPFCVLAVLVWAVFAEASAGRWVVLGIAVALAVLGEVAKYLWPARRMVASGVPSRSVVLGAVGAVAGFFVVPVVGAPLGFVAGVWLAEAQRFQQYPRPFQAAWPSTQQALVAIGLSILVELMTVLLIAITWLVGLLVT